VCSLSVLKNHLLLNFINVFGIGSSVVFLLLLLYFFLLISFSVISFFSGFVVSFFLIIG